MSEVNCFPAQFEEPSAFKIESVTLNGKREQPYPPNWRVNDMGQNRRTSKPSPSGDPLPLIESGRKIGERCDINTGQLPPGNQIEQRAPLCARESKI
jgi:hypothetical protein